MSSDSSVKSSKSTTSKASRWSTNTHDTKATGGISVEPLPDRWASKKRQEKEKQPMLSAPSEEDEDDFEEEYEDEVIDINDEQEDDFGAEQEMPVNFGRAPPKRGLKRTDSKAFMVDRVPRKLYTSQNVDNFPIWPPVIKVRDYQAARCGDVSGVSIGSGFTDDDYLTDDFSSDEEESFTETAKALPPAMRTSYRIRYDGPTKLNLDVYKTDNRFASTVEHVQPAGAPSLPSRNMDSTPGLPPRRQTSGFSDSEASEYSEELESREFVAGEESRRTRPDVWITALSGDQEEDVIWNVRRVWDIEKEDEIEKEISVHSTQLFSQLKSLVGADDDDSLSKSERTTATNATAKSDVKPKMPTRSWQIQKVVESKGRLADLEPAKQLDNTEMVKDIQIMNVDAVVELKENIKAQEELVRKITERRIEKKEKKEKGIMEPVVEDTEEAAPPLAKEELDRWLAVPDVSERDEDPVPTPPQTPKRTKSDSVHTVLTMEDSIVSTKDFEAKEPVIAEDEKEAADTSIPESTGDETLASSTAKVEKASETASVNTSSLDSLQSSATPLEVKPEEPLPPPEPPAPVDDGGSTPPPPTAKRRSMSPKSPKTPKTGKSKSPVRKSGGSKKKDRTRSSKSPRTPMKHKSVQEGEPRVKSLKPPMKHKSTPADEAPRTPRRNVSNEDLVQATPKSAKRERRKGAKKKEKKTKKTKKEKKPPSAADLLQTSSDESDIDPPRPSSDRMLPSSDKGEVVFDPSSQKMVLKKDHQPQSPKRRSTTVDSRKMSMAAMVMDSDSDSDDSSDSNTDAATKNLMKRQNQGASGGATPWWKKQQQAQAAKKGGARPIVGRKVQSARHFNI